MNVYIWKRRNKMTENYHDEGGAVAVAACIEEARAMLSSIWGLPPDSAALTTDPDITYPVPADAEPYAEVFPDAGCC